MSADTLTADGAPVTISPPPGTDSGGHPYIFPGYDNYTPVPGADEIVFVAASANGPSQYQITAAGYSLGGALLFQTTLADANGLQENLNSPTLALLGSGNVAFAFNSVDTAMKSGTANNAYAIVSPSGSVVTHGITLMDQSGGYSMSEQGPPTLYATPTGFNMEWTESSYYVGPGTHYAYAVQSFDMAANSSTRSVTPESGWGEIKPTPHALAVGAAGSLQVSDNTVQYDDGSALGPAVTIPGEPAHAITGEAAATLANGEAAVAWADSGTDYVSLFDPATNSFGPVIGLDWGDSNAAPGVVALPDGGFAVSWGKNGAYLGELFDAAGNGGGIITLAGKVAGIDAHGDLYTVAMNSNDQYVVQTYAINGSGGSSGGTGGGGTTGQTFSSDNNGDHWVGTSGDDIFHLGRGGDVVTGNGGNDTYTFAEIPWAGGHITDFNAGDVLDLTGLMSTTADTGSDGFADGYLRITSDSAGDAQVWAQYATSGSSSGWWLVETLDGVSASSLQTSGDVVTVGSGGSGTGPSAVTTSDSNYVAPSYVTSITLSGSQQHIDASATSGVTITSNNTGNVLIGGSGDDLFHLGRGGDAVTGGAGADTFAYAETPWAAGSITDFNGSQGDVIDVRGMLSASGYSGSDPFTDGYLRITDSAAGAQIWSDVNQPGNTGWWLVATIDGVSTSSLHYSAGLIT